MSKKPMIVAAAAVAAILISLGSAAPIESYCAARTAPTLADSPEENTPAVPVFKSASPLDTILNEVDAPGDGHQWSLEWPYDVDAPATDVITWYQDKYPNASVRTRAVDDTDAATNAPQVTTLTFAPPDARWGEKARVTITPVSSMASKLDIVVLKPFAEGAVDPGYWNVVIANFSLVMGVFAIGSKNTLKRL